MRPKQRKGQTTPTFLFYNFTRELTRENLIRGARRLGFTPAKVCPVYKALHIDLIALTPPKRRGNKEMCRRLSAAVSDLGSMSNKRIWV